MTALLAAAEDALAWARGVDRVVQAAEAAVAAWGGAALDAAPLDLDDALATLGQGGY